MAGAMAPSSRRAAGTVGAVSSPKVIVKQVARPVEYDPEIRVEFDGECCTQSEISWGNPSTMRALRALFGVSGEEKIVAVVITSRGIKAELRRG